MDKLYNINLKKILLVCLCSFGIVLISRLLAIHFYGVDVPFWDQWDEEATRLFLPYLNHSLELKSLFLAPLSEHSIFFTRLLNLILFILHKRMWSPLLEMQVSSVFPALTAMLLSYWHIKDRQAIKLPSIAIITIIISVPLGWEILLWGSVQSEFYIFILLSIIIIRLISNAQDISVFRFIFIVLLCMAAFFSMANAMLPTSLAGGFLILRNVYERKRTKFIIFGILLILLACVMKYCTPTLAWERTYKIASLHGFIIAFVKLFLFRGPFAHGNIIFWTPMFGIIATMFYKGYKETMQKYSFPILLYGFVLLNLIAITYERKGIFANRYTGIYLLIVVAAVFTIDEFMQTCSSAFLKKAQKIGYIAIALLFLASVPRYLKHYLQPEKDYRTQTVYSLQKAIKLLKTDPKASLKILATPPLSYPSAIGLQNKLNNPTILNFLPKKLTTN